MVEELKLDEFYFLYGITQKALADEFGLTRQGLWQQANLHPSVVEIDRDAGSIRLVRLGGGTSRGNHPDDQILKSCSTRILKGKKRRKLS